MAETPADAEVPLPPPEGEAEHQDESAQPDAGVEEKEEEDEEDDGDLPVDDCSLTPRVLAAVEDASWLGQEGEEDYRPLLPLEVLESGYWEAVRNELSKLSSPDLMQLLRSRGMPAPPGKEKRLDKAIEYFQEVVRDARQARAEEKRKAREEARFRAKQEAAATNIQCMIRSYAARKERRRREILRAEEAERQRIAEETAENWRKAQSTCETCIVWFHGQGETEVGWQEVFSNYKAPAFAEPCRWLWPRSESSPCTSRFGAWTSQWFDTPEFPVCRVVRGVPDRHRRGENEAEVAQAVMVAHAVLDALIAEGLPGEHIVVGGFGQGAALAAHAVLRYKHRLGGAALLSAWVPCMEALEATVKQAGLKTKLLWVHGARDAVVHPDIALLHAQQLRSLGAKVNFRLYPELAFGISSAAISCIEEFLTRRFEVEYGERDDDDDDEGEEDEEKEDDVQADAATAPDAEGSNSNEEKQLVSAPPGDAAVESSRAGTKQTVGDTAAEGGA